MDLFEGTESFLPPFELPDEKGYEFSWNESLKGFDIKLPQGQLFYAEKYFDEKISNRSVEYFQENDTFDWKSVDWTSLSNEQLSAIKFKNIAWKHDSIRMYGKEMPLPRLTSWYGDEGKGYTYSGITSRPNAWNKGLLHIKGEVERAAAVNFNSVLLNWYRSGEDYLNWHADDERELGKNPVIASVSFGETRDFLIRRCDDHKAKISIPLSHGSLLVMRGELQHYWQHSVPKRKKIEGSRFNLTFRRILNA